MSIKKVILVGAGGNLGPAILKALLTKFDVTILTREGSAILNNPPQGAKVVVADYSNPSSLVEAFKGQDAVVSTIGALALSDQKKLIDAAVDAGVKRFIPSEFGSDTLSEKNSALAVFRNKVATAKYLKEKAAEGKITWTAIAIGPFFDWGLKVGFLGFNIAEKKATFYDGGNRPFSATTLAEIGQTTVSVLSHPEETKNRYVFVNSAVVTQREILDIYEKLTGTKWEVEEKDTAELEKETNAKLAAGDYSTIHHLIYRTIFADGYSGEFKKTDNDLLGIKRLDKAGVEEVVKSTL